MRNRFMWSAAALLLATALAAPAQQLSEAEVRKYLEQKDKVFFLDVREPEEVAQLGSMPGYVNIPITQLEQRLKEIPKEKLIITA